MHTMIHSKVIDHVKSYRQKVLEVLKQQNNHYGVQQINLKVLDKDINYNRWLHPWQGDWEVEHLFSEQILSNLSKIIDKDSTVLDIGAQTGYMSVAYSLFAKRVIAFEPNPAAFEVLESSAKLNENIEPYNLAISDEEGPLKFHYSDNGFCNGGFATRTNFGIGVTGHKVPIDVFGVNLIKFLEGEDIGKISLVKIDAEGHDKDILKTISPIIEEHKPYLISEIYDGLDTSEVKDLLDTIQGLGYKIYDEEVNKCDLNNLGPQIKSPSDIQPGSGHNLFCIL